MTSLPGYHKKKNQKNSEAEEALNANKLYMVAPFLGPLKKWIARQRQHDAAKGKQRPSEVCASGVEGIATDTDYVVIDDAMAGSERRAHLQESFEGTILDPSTKGSHHESTSNPQPGLEDPAAALKRMLSVGEQQPDVQEGLEQELGNGNSDNLLAVLRDNAQPGENSILGKQPVPQTPFTQVDTQPPLPRSPRHSSSRPPLFSNMPPPPTFPLPLENLRQPINASETPAQTRFGYNNRAPQMDSFDSHSQMQERSAHRLHQPFDPIPGRNPQVQCQGNPTPYDHPRDPQISMASQQPQSNGPVVPSASKLPAPKLNNHTLNLLNTLKGTDEKAVSAEQKPLPKQENAGFRQSPASAGRHASSIKPEEAGRHPGVQATFGGLIPSSLGPIYARNQKPAAPTLVQNKPNAPQDTLLGALKSPSETSILPQQTPQQESKVAEASKANAHQKALLNLFKTPAAAMSTEVKTEPTQVASIVPMPLTTQKSAQVEGLTVRPVELSAASTPKVETEKKQLSESETRASRIDKSPAKSTVMPYILQRPNADVSSMSPAMTSARLSGPPDFVTAGRNREPSMEKNVTPRKELADKSSKKSGKVLKNEPTNTPSAPIQILQRPKDKQAPEALSTEASSRAHQKNESVEDKQASDTSTKPLSTRKHELSRHLATPSKRVEANGFSPKPLQTQILRRPKEGSQSSATTTDQRQIKHKATGSEERRKALIALLGPAYKKQDIKETQSPPVSTPNSAKASPFKFPNPPADDPITPTAPARVSRANDTASPMIQLMKSPANSMSSAHKERINKDRRESGAQTPISPADKAFLSNYLEEALKKGGL